MDGYFLALVSLNKVLLIAALYICCRKTTSRTLLTKHNLFSLNSARFPVYILSWILYAYVFAFVDKFYAKVM